MKIKKLIEKKPLSIKQFYEKRNKILFLHQMGGLGDVFIHRMMFEDVKSLIPEAYIVLACLPEYIDAAKNHPYIDEVVDSKTVNHNDYLICYNTCVTVADRYEYKTAPFCKEHRADIWGKYIGLELKNHNMHFNINTEYGLSKLKEVKKNCQPSIAFIPTSAMASKSLNSCQIKGILSKLKDFNIFGINKKIIPEFTELNIPFFTGQSIPQWMSIIASADYVISVDTAAFHLAGGLGKPLTGIFAWSDGKIYGKYFDFILVQKHRDNGNWDCGPCFKFNSCPKMSGARKPCIEFTVDEIYSGIEKMLEKWPSPTLL